MYIPHEVTEVSDRGGVHIKMALKYQHPSQSTNNHQELSDLVRLKVELHSKLTHIRMKGDLKVNGFPSRFFQINPPVKKINSHLIKNLYSLVVIPAIKIFNSIMISQNKNS